MGSSSWLWACDVSATGSATSLCLFFDFFSFLGGDASGDGAFSGAASLEGAGNDAGGGDCCWVAGLGGAQRLNKGAGICVEASGLWCQVSSCCGRRNYVLSQKFEDAELWTRNADRSCPCRDARQLPTYAFATALTAQQRCSPAAPLQTAMNWSSSCIWRG
jgi:hypothetical protein